MAPRSPEHRPPAERRLLADPRPGEVLHLMASILEAALAGDADDVRSTEVRVGKQGRITLAPSGTGASIKAETAPEAARSGPTPSTLVFSVAAIGAGTVIEGFAAAPDDPKRHEQWLADVQERLFREWDGGPVTEMAADLIGRCLARDPFARPHPEHVITAVHAAGFAPEPATPPTVRREVEPSSLGTSTPNRSGIAELPTVPWIPAPLDGRVTHTPTRLSPPGAPAVRRAPPPMARRWAGLAVIAALVSVVSLAVAACALGALVSRHLMPPAVVAVPSPAVVVPVPVPVAAAPTASAETVAGGGVADLEPGDAAPDATVDAATPAPVPAPSSGTGTPSTPTPTPTPTPTSTPTPRPAASAQPAPSAPTPASDGPTPAPAPSGGGDDLKDPWRN